MIVEDSGRIAEERDELAAQLEHATRQLAEIKKRTASED